MAATLTMSGGGGQEDPFYPLQKATLPAGFPLEDSALFGLDCKLTDKDGQSDFTQVTNAAGNQSDFPRRRCVSLNGRGRSVVDPGCYLLASTFHSASPRYVNQHFVPHCLRQ